MHDFYDIHPELRLTNKNGSIPVAYRQFFSLQTGQSIVVYYNPYMPSDFVIPQKISS